MDYAKGLTAVLAWTVLALCAHGATKRYGIESGSVRYAISGGGALMGLKTVVKGNRQVAFREWGNVEVSEGYEENSVSSAEKQIRHTHSKLEGSTLYSVDFDEKVILADDMARHPYAQGWIDNTPWGREMMEKNGGKLVGYENVLGYPCEVWEFMGSRIWGHKGVVLKITTDAMGITVTETAVDAHFDHPIPDAGFVLPDYPVRTVKEHYRIERMSAFDDE